MIETHPAEDGVAVIPFDVANVEERGLETGFREARDICGRTRVAVSR